MLRGQGDLAILILKISGETGNVVVEYVVIREAQLFKYF